MLSTLDIKLKYIRHTVLISKARHYLEDLYTHLRQILGNNYTQPYKYFRSNTNGGPIVTSKSLLNNTHIYHHHKLKKNLL